MIEMIEMKRGRCTVYLHIFAICKLHVRMPNHTYRYIQYLDVSAMMFVKNGCLAPLP